MSAPLWSLLPLSIAAIGCGPSHRELEPWDWTSDRGADADGDVPGVDAPSEAVDAADGTHATFVYPPLEPAEEWCTDPGVEAASPGLFVHGGLLFAFHNGRVASPGPGDSGRRLMLRTADVRAPSFDPAVPLAVDGYPVDLLAFGDDLWVVTAGPMISTFLLHTTDHGAVWSVEEVFAGGSDSGVCTYNVPSVFVRPAEASRRLVLGFDNDSHIFGCSAQARWTFLDGGVWAEPGRIADGAPAGAFVTPAGIVVATTGGVVLSTDGGATFAPIPGGDTTSTRVVGERLAMTADGTLFLVQSYGYALRQVVALVISRDGGATWPERIVLADEAEADAYFFGPTVAAARTDVIVAWRRGDPRDILGSYHRCSAWATESPDDGASWSIPASFEATSSDENVWSVAAATDGNGEAGARSFVAYAVTGENPTWQPRRVCVVRLTFALAP
ncbi:MAG: exo-alpha-sialidase [Deltaproteobacteria bacterium]|nr:exo-alpha-sialidase [Deltaproteobacteria bacterium]